jgi:hypothetical protein
VEITELQDILKLVSILLETQVDTELQVRVHYSFVQRVESPTEGNGANRAGKYRVYIVKCRVLLGYFFIGKL